MKITTYQNSTTDIVDISLEDLATISIGLDLEFNRRQKTGRPSHDNDLRDLVKTINDAFVKADSIRRAAEHIDDDDGSDD